MVLLPKANFNKEKCLVGEKHFFLIEGWGPFFVPQPLGAFDKSVANAFFFVIINKSRRFCWGALGTVFRRNDRESLNQWGFTREEVTLLLIGINVISFWGACMIITSACYIYVVIYPRFLCGCANFVYDCAYMCVHVCAFQSLRTNACIPCWQFFSQ